MKIIKKRVLRSLSSCIKEKFNSFTFANIRLAKKQKDDLVPINIIYEPVKKQDQIIKCYFTNDLKNAYRALYHKSQRILTANTYRNAIIATIFGLIKASMKNI